MTRKMIPLTLWVQRQGRGEKGRGEGGRGKGPFTVISGNDSNDLVHFLWGKFSEFDELFFAHFKLHLLV
jgi:hypothetical protein